MVGAVPLAYAVIVSGSLIKNKRLTLRTDLSYGAYIYAFPTQQLLAVCGLAQLLNPFLFFGIATTAILPLAAFSWFVVEKPAMALKSRLKRKWTAPAVVDAGGDRDATSADPITCRRLRKHRAPPSSGQLPKAENPLAIR